MYLLRNRLNWSKSIRKSAARRPLLFTLLAVILVGIVVTGSFISVVSASRAKRAAEQSHASTSQKTDSGPATEKEAAPQAQPGLVALRDLSTASAYSHWAALRRFATPLSPAAPTLTATKADAIVIDGDGDGKADPGDTLEYTVVVSNTTAGMDATNVVFTDTVSDTNLMFVTGSVMTTPLALNDSYTASGNIQITVAAPGVLANDIDPDGVGPALTVSGPSTTTQGGNLTLNANGSFTYNPAPGFEGTDTFTYTLSDGEGNTDTATVTITVSGMIWFIDDSATCPCDGRLTNPFNALTGAGSFNAVAADDPGDNIFLYSGNYTGGLTLLNNQRFIGQGATASLSSITGINPPAGSLALPSTGGANPVVSAAVDNITLGSGNTIRGVTLNVTAAGATAITGSSFGTLTVADTTVGGTNGRALSLTTGNLAATFASLSSTNSSTTGITLSGVTGSLTSGSTTITNPGGIGLSVGTSSATLNFANTSSTASGGTGVSLLTNTGTITFGSLTITPDASQRGLLATDNSQTITATSGAITTSGATAVEITKSSGTTPLAISETSVTATGGPANGIKLTNTSGSFTVTGNAGTCTLATQTCTGGSIQSATGAGVLINNSTNVSLSLMKIQNSGGDGIDATSLNGFTYNNGIITDVNTAGSVNGTTNDCGIQFTNASGTLTVSNSVIDQAPHDGIQLINTSTNLTAFNFTNSTVSNMPNTTTSNNGILLVANGSSTFSGVTVTGSTFTGIFATGIQVDTNGSATNSNITVQTSHFTNNNIAMNFTQNGTGAATINILNNTDINNHLSNAMNFATAQASTGGGITAKIQSNTIGTQNVKDSGSATGIAIRANVNGQAHGVFRIDANTIWEVPNARAIEMIGRLGSGGANFKVTNNTVHAPTGTNKTICDGSTMTPCPLAPVYIESNSGNTVCSIVNGNTTYNPQPIGFGGEFAYYLHKGSTAPANTMNIENNGGDASATAAVTNHNTPNSPVQVDAGVNLVAAGACGTFPARPQPNTDAASEGAASQTPDAMKGGSDAEKEDVLFATGLEKPRQERVQSLNQGSLNWMVQAALTRWEQSGISAEDMMRLRQVTFEVADLPGDQLATATSTSVKIDETAAGFDWYLDSTPLDNEEFDVAVPGRELQTTEHSPAFGRMDLMTVVTRELGIAYKHGRKTVIKGLKPLMQNTLSPAVRRVPNSQKITLPTPAVGIEGAGQSSNTTNSGSQANTVATSSQSNTSLNHAASRTAGANSPAVPDVTVNVPTLPGNKSITIKFRAMIKSPLVTAAGSVCNQGHVHADGPIDVDTTDPGPPVVNGATCTPLDVADLSLTKTDSPDPVSAGANITYTLNFKNNGPSAANMVALSDAVPANTTLVSVTTPAGWTRTDVVPAGGTGTLTFTKNADAANQETATFTIIVKVNSNVASGTTINNSATVTSPKTDPDSSNNTATASTTVQTRADLAVTKLDSPDPVTAGNNITYTINYQNNGPSDAQTVQLSDAIPANTTFVSVTTPAGWTRTDSVPAGGTGTITFTKATSAVGDTASWTLVVNVNSSATAGSIITNNATASSATTDPTPANDTGTATTTVNRQADLELTKTDSPDPVNAGDNLTYTLSFTNHGPSDASTVTVSDATPANTTLVSVTTPAGWSRTDAVPAGGTGTISFAKSSVANQETATFTIIVKVSSSAADASTITNSATTSSATTDPTPGNNTGTATTTVINQADLVVTKTDSPDPVNAGSNLTYTIHVVNNGPGTANTVSVSDATPANTTFVSVTTPAGWSRTDATPVGGTGTITFTKSSVANGETADLVIVVHVNANTAAGTTITNSATATSSNESNNANNTGTATTTVATSADISVTKTDSPDPVTAGTDLTYTVTITNNGPSDAQSVQLTDSTPTHTTFVSEMQSSGPMFNCTNPSAGSTGTTTCTIATLASGTSAVFQIVVHVDANTAAGTTITNNAVGSSTTTDPTPGNNTGTATTTVNASADISVTKSDSPDPVTAGTLLTYTITITNNGPSDAQSVQLTDATPAQTTFVSEMQNSGPTFNCTNPTVGMTGTTTCTIATLAAGTSATFTIIDHVDANASGTITNDAVGSSSTTDPTPGNNTGTATTTVNALADLSVTKTDSPDPVTAGSNLTYTITVTNNGPSDAQNLQLSDTLPANTTFVSFTVPAGWSRTDAVPAGGTGTVTATASTLASGASAQFTLVVNVNANTASGSTINNSATVSSGTTDLNNTNNTGSSSTTVNTSADISVTKTDSPDPVTAGTDLTYTVTITNNGPSDAQSVQLTDSTPTHTTFVSEMQSSGPMFNCTNPSAGSTGTTTCTIATLASGSSAVFEIKVHVNANTANGTTINNSAVGSSTTTDPTPGNNTGTSTTTVGTSADIEVTKTDSPDPVTAGTDLTYTITITNHGPSDAQSVQLTDTTPTHTTFVSEMQSSGPIFNCTNPSAGSTGTTTCTIATLASGSSAVFQIVVHVDANTAAGTTITNNAVGSSTTTDSTSGNNTGTSTTTVSASADLSVTKSDSPDPVSAGTNLTYTITVTNNGPSDAQSLQLSDPLPANTTFVSLTVPAGWSRTDATPVGGTGTVTATATTLASGASAQFTLVVNVNVNTSHGAMLINNATASSSTTDPNSGNNTGTTTTTVNARADLEISKTDLADPVMFGSNISYHIVVHNNGPGNALGVVVTDKMPQNVAFVSATPSAGSCMQAAGTVTCNVGDMNNGGADVTVDLVVQANTVNTIQDTASVTSTTGDPKIANNKATQSTRVVGFRHSAFTLPIITGGCDTSVGKLYFTTPAPAGVTISFTDNSPFVDPIAPVTTTGGETFIQVVATTQIVTAEKIVDITATAGANVLTSRLKLLPVRIKTFTFSPNPVAGGQVTTGTVTLTCPAPKDILVKLTYDKSLVKPDVTSFTIPMGQTSGQFTVTTKKPLSQTVGTVTAMANGGTSRASVTVTP